MFERYNIVSPGDLVEAARKLDAVRQNRDGHTFGHTGAFRAVANGAASPQVVDVIGAGDGDRTRDIRLGKPAFYR